MAKAPGIGKLRHRVTVESIANTPDGQGGFTSVWSTFATLWAEIMPVSASEMLFAEQVSVRRTHKCRMRYLATITTEMRLTFNSRQFQIKGIRYPDERKFYMLLDLEEGTPT